MLKFYKRGGFWIIAWPLWRGLIHIGSHNPWKLWAMLPRVVYWHTICTIRDRRDKARI